VSSSFDWEEIFRNPNLEHLEQQFLPSFLPRQRWFGGKARRISSTLVSDWGPFDLGRSALVVVEVTYEAGEPDIYLTPLSISFGEASAEIQEKFPNAVVGSLETQQGIKVLHDGLYDNDALLALLALIAQSAEIGTSRGTIRGLPSNVFAALRGTTELHPRRSSAEQSNSSIFYGDKLIMKLFRRVQAGINPDIEIGRFLTEETNFRNIAAFGGSIEYRRGGDSYAIAMLQGLVDNQGDGWQWTLDELDRYYQAQTSEEFPAIAAASIPSDFLSLSKYVLPADIFAIVGDYLHAASTLGRRTGELHVALGSATVDVAFIPERFSAREAEALREQLLENATLAFDALSDNLARLPVDLIEPAARTLRRREVIFERLSHLSSQEPGGLRIRVHGDYHLGQVLRTHSDFVILDFEGEPAKSLVERRAKQSPLKDVAGMLRSFSYAAFASFTRVLATSSIDSQGLEPWAHLWERSVHAAFLSAYREAVARSPIVPSDPTEFQSLLEVYVLDKALYELVYELNNRPTWVRIPLNGILSLSN